MSELGAASGAPPGFRRACAASEVVEGEAHAVEIDGLPIAIVRTEGELFAIDDVCSHEDIPLSEGEIEGCTVECWLHGSRFDLRTGKPTGLPATEPVPVYAVRVEGDDVYIAVGAGSPNPAKESGDADG